MTTFDAVYRGGVIHPLTPIGFAEGTPVRVTVESAPSPAPDSFDPAEVCRLIKAIADLPEEPGGDPTVTARNHDAILYGGPKGVR